jgi:hypothetical protein
VAVQQAATWRALLVSYHCPLCQQSILRHIHLDILRCRLAWEALRGPASTESAGRPRHRKQCTDNLVRWLCCRRPAGSGSRPGVPPQAASCTASRGGEMASRSEESAHSVESRGASSNRWYNSNKGQADGLLRHSRCIYTTVPLLWTAVCHTINACAHSPRLQAPACPPLQLQAAATPPPPVLPGWQLARRQSFRWRRWAAGVQLRARLQLGNAPCASVWHRLPTQNTSVCSPSALPSDLRAPPGTGLQA